MPIVSIRITLLPCKKCFDSFECSLREHYVPSAFLCVDGQLIKFRVFMKDKLGKYGVLLHMMSDAGVPYCLSIQLYTGRPASAESTIAPGKSKDAVHQLTKHYYHTGQDVTMDRFYTSIELSRVQPIFMRSNILFRMYMKSLQETLHSYSVNNLL